MIEANSSAYSKGKLTRQTTVSFSFTHLIIQYGSCEKIYLYPSSLKKHYMVSHADEY